MILGKNRVPESGAVEGQLYKSAGGRFINLDRFPLSNVNNESAAASIFIEVDANSTFQFTPFSNLDTRRLGGQDYYGLRPHPLLGYDKNLMSSNVTLELVITALRQETTIEFGEYDIFMPSHKQSAFYRLTNNTAQKQIVRFDDFFVFADIELGRNINRGFDFNNITRSRTLENEYGNTAVIERNNTREINVSISLVDKEQMEKIRLFLVKQRQEPFMAILDPKAVTVAKSEILSGKFFVRGPINPKHSFGGLWSLKFRLREHV